MGQQCTPAKGVYANIISKKNEKKRKSEIIILFLPFLGSFPFSLSTFLFKGRMVQRSLKVFTNLLPFLHSSHILFIFFLFIQDEEIGGYMVQQNVSGRPVTVFRFPPRTRLKALSHTTVRELEQNEHGNVSNFANHSIKILEKKYPIT